MVSLWIVYLMLIAMGHWFRIDSPLYTSIYSYFLIFVLAVTFLFLITRRMHRVEDSQFLWFTVFAVIVMSQLGSVLGAGANRPYFAAFLAVALPVVFFKTMLSSVGARTKVTMFAMAFLLLAVTKLTYLLVLMWNQLEQIDGYVGWLIEVIALNGGLDYFVSVSRLEAAAEWLRVSVEGQAAWEQVALAASNTALEAVMVLLPPSAAVFAVIWGVKHYMQERSLKRDAKEKERLELERLESEKKQRDREENERLERAKVLVNFAQAGETHAQYELGMLYLGASNYEQGVPLLQAAADKNHALSQYELGQLYCNGGEGFEPDAAKAYVLLERAGNAGNTEAQFLVGSMYFIAAGIDEPDYAQAALWWGKASASGHIEAMSKLAKLHTMVDEFPEADAHLAIKLFKKLANEKSIPDQDLPINMMYYNPKAPWSNYEKPGKATDRATKRARSDEIKAEMYWLNEGIKQMQKFLKDYADDWDWRNDETKKKIKDDQAKISELKEELEQLTKRKIV